MATSQLRNLLREITRACETRHIAGMSPSPTLSTSCESQQLAKSREASMRTGKLAALLLGAAFVLGAALAVPPASAGNPKGNETKGKFYFRQSCKSCHTKGAVGTEITPLNKTTAQWHSYFIAAKHNHGREMLEKVLTAEQLRDVQAYLEAHASDSLQPETCGK
jgi:mono/diheme cytochrome c family protein